MKYLKLLIAGALVFGPFAANADVIYADYDDRNDPLEFGQSTGGTLDLINAVNDASFTATGYGGSADGTFSDNLGFPLGTATSGIFHLWVQYMGEFSVIQTNVDVGSAGGFNFTFAQGTLSGTVLGVVNATGALDWTATLVGLTLNSVALIDGVGLTVSTPDPAGPNPEPNPNPVPEPGTLALLGLGLAGLGMTRRRKKA